MIKNIIFIITVFICSSAFGANKKVISIGGSNTEIIYRLQAQNLLIGTDTTSYFPKAAQSLPKVGYHRNLSAEGVLSLNPDLIILTDQAGPKSVINQLKATDIKILQLKSPKNINDVVANIKKIGRQLNHQKEAQNLISKINKQRKLLKLTNSKKPNILVLLNHGKNSPSAAGKNSAADEIIQLSGGVNVVDEFENYKVISRESIIAKNPDIIIIAQPMLENIADKNGLKNNISLKNTEAFRNNQIYVFDALEILGFGPRTVESAIKLNELYKNL